MRIGRQKNENPMIYDQRPPGLKRAGKIGKAPSPERPDRKAKPHYLWSRKVVPDLHAFQPRAVRTGSPAPSDQWRRAYVCEDQSRFKPSWGGCPALQA
jgi:hypothetical protein